MLSTTPSGRPSDRLQPLHGGAELLAGGLPVAYDDQRAVGLGGQQRGVGHRQQRRGVDDHDVEGLCAPVPISSDIACDCSSSAGFGGMAPLGSTVRFVHACPGERVVRGRSARPGPWSGLPRCPRPGSPPSSAGAGHRRRGGRSDPACAKRDGEVGGGRRLALTGDRAGDHEDLAVVVDVDELEVGAQHPERLDPRSVGLEGGDEWLRCEACGSKLIPPITGAPARLGRVLRPLDRGVEHLADHREAEAEQEARGPRPGRCCGRGSARPATQAARAGPRWWP